MQCGAARREGRVRPQEVRMRLLTGLLLTAAIVVGFTRPAEGAPRLPLVDPGAEALRAGGRMDGPPGAGSLPSGLLAGTRRGWTPP